mmetsp:Transcript_32411/g.79036  ORF Transcript_32411/g.79036 Transcript_32411/m.79036 type:complete len:100 (-) Transcript_32411:1497-1796(-)
MQSASSSWFSTSAVATVNLLFLAVVRNAQSALPPELAGDLPVRCSWFIWLIAASFGFSHLVLGMVKRIWRPRDNAFYLRETRNGLTVEIETGTQLSIFD